MKFIQILLLICIFALTALALMSAYKVESLFPEFRPLMAIGTALVFAPLLFLFVMKILLAFEKHWDLSFFRSEDLFMGLIIVLVVFGSSLAFFGPNLSLVDFTRVPWGDLLFQIRPALIEEIGFRFGLVLLGLIFFGPRTALLMGSIPFGILHLLNFHSGQQIYWDYIIGTSVAGLFLSLIFLNFNLGSAVLVHYTWNVLASLSAKTMDFKQEDLEGSTATLGILLLASLCLWIRAKKKDPVSWAPYLKNKIFKTT